MSTSNVDIKKENIGNKSENESVKDKAINAGKTLAESASTLKDDASDIVSQSYKNIKDTAKDQYTHLTNYYKDNPLTSVAVAMAAGLLVGKFWNK